ncbi:MAG: DUF1501 domain-containing protein [Rudaea sp.]|nr:DUF1501 domain-containing protein [Rudaea sp.]
MSPTRNSRREFMHKLCCLAASGGAAAMIPQLRMLGTALANAKSLSGYKALVCIELSGGNDAWNMLVPYDTTRYNVYTTSRSGIYNAATNPGGLALPLPTGSQIAAQVVTDMAGSSGTNQYFLNPSLTNSGSSLAPLFTSGNLAFVVNAGTLIKPITMSQYNASSANNPPQLFSHADQTNQWQQAYANETVATGWGGLCAENLQGQGANLTTNPVLPLSISIAGANRFEIGASTVPYQMSSGGLAALSGVCNPTCTGGASDNSLRNTALNALLAETYASDFAGSYNQLLAQGRELYDLLSPNLAAYAPKTAFPANNSLAAQLKMVATMINLSNAKQYATRQIYFVQQGGFDLHSGFWSANGGHAALLTELSAALSAFNTAMGPTDINLQDSVTAFTASEFARTLQSNGSGSDHGWGSLHMVLGGAVNGGKLYSNGGGPISGFPNQALNAPNNFSRGQMIPGIGVEQYAATLAQWMGITSTTDLNAIFPNLVNFGTNTNLGFV